MSGQSSSEKETPTVVDEATVIDYLRRTPDFFQRNPSTLAELELSHDCGGAASLIEHQVNTLRGQNKKLRSQLEKLVKIARDNDKLNERMHRLTLALMDAENLNALYVALDDSLRGDFQIDAMNVKLFTDASLVEVDPDCELMKTIMVPMADPRLSAFKAILSHEKPVCGRLQPEQMNYMFGEGNDIASTAVIPLGGESCTTIDCPFLGVLVIGSRDPKCFQPNMGTLFLGNLGEVVSRAIKQHIIHK
ncbi:MAG TPA: DUF484 family protein [Candidatus Tenderia sp.]|nr:DUF484 family protein [Candidatus Tenderia sp.]